MNRLSWGLVRGIVSTAFGIVFGLSLGACIVAILATRFFDYSILTVQSDSMKPALERGDIVVTRPVAAQDLRSGDVVYFTERTTGLPFVHRVVAIHRTVTEIRDGKTNEHVDENVKYGFVTKGDAALVADPAEVGVDTLRGEHASLTEIDQLVEPFFSPPAPHRKVSVGPSPRHRPTILRGPRPLVA